MDKPEKHAEHDSDLRSYLWGFVFSVVLSAAAFGVVLRGELGRQATMVVLGCLGMLQLFVQLRYFLHIDGRRENQEDLYLILFSVLVLLMMVIGTVWVLGDLAGRMGMEM
ncbi:cytochrome o ubiquinol oxidase subunit IV [Mariniblastus sp.]|nr:cytochrome o ubiquinol oxidase subunit IV [Mariniblastus sp.]